MAEIKTHIVQEAGWCAGLRVKKGDKVQMTDAQAKYEITLNADEVKRRQDVKSHQEKVPAKAKKVAK